MQCGGKHHDPLPRCCVDRAHHSVHIHKGVTGETALAGWHGIRLSTCMFRSSRPVRGGAESSICRADSRMNVLAADALGEASPSRCTEDFDPALRSVRAREPAVQGDQGCIERLGEGDVERVPPTD